MDNENAFDDPHVVECYRHRPDYPADLYRRLLELAPDRNSLLDLGCGPGKISRPLASEFEHVDAVDPSAAMLGLARSLPNGQAANLTWILGRGEDAELPHAPYSLITAAASIHWMDHDLLFPRLHQIAPNSVVAVIDGDGAHEPPWQAPWAEFMERWIPNFIACQHSRKTFTYQKLGSLAQQFDSELTQMLSPFSKEGYLSFTVRTHLTWGTTGTNAVF